MALDVDDAAPRGLLDEGAVELGGGAPEGDVGDRARALLDQRLEEFARVEKVVDAVDARPVALFHGLKAALVLDPVEDEAADVDAPAVGGVVERALVGLEAVAHVGRDDVAEGGAVCDEVVAADDDRGARGAGVFLGAREDEAVALDVERAREEHARDVRDDGDVAGVGKLAAHGAVDRLVLAEVEVVEVLVDRLVDRRGAQEPVGLAGRDDVGLAVLAGLLPGEARPVARDDVAGAPLAHEVHGDTGELQRRAALQEHDAVVVRDGHEAPERLLGVVDDLLERGGAVAHLHDGHAAAAIVEHLGGGPLEYGLGQCGGARGEVERS